MPINNNIMVNNTGDEKINIVKVKTNVVLTEYPFYLITHNPSHCPKLDIDIIKDKVKKLQDKQPTMKTFIYKLNDDNSIVINLQPKISLDDIFSSLNKKLQLCYKIPQEENIIECIKSHLPPDIQLVIQEPEPAKGSRDNTFNNSTTQFEENVILNKKSLENKKNEAKCTILIIKKLKIKKDTDEETPKMTITVKKSSNFSEIMEKIKKDVDTNKEFKYSSSENMEIGKCEFKLSINDEEKEYDVHIKLPAGGDKNSFFDELKESSITVTVLNLDNKFLQTFNDSYEKYVGNQENIETKITINTSVPTSDGKVKEVRQAYTSEEEEGEYKVEITGQSGESIQENVTTECLDETILTGQSSPQE